MPLYEHMTDTTPMLYRNNEYQSSAWNTQPFQVLEELKTTTNVLLK